MSSFLPTLPSVMGSVAARLYLLIHVLSILALIHSSVAVDPAWNGYVPPGTAPANTAFTPYYPAPGTITFDSRSSSIIYTGNWNQDHSPLYVDNSTHSTSDPHASFSLRFKGTGIEWFGSRSSRHGSAHVFLDGKPMGPINIRIRSSTPQVQQRLCSFPDLPYGYHDLKVVNDKSSHIDIDALVVTDTSTQNHGPRHIASDSILPRSAASTLHQKGSTGVAAMQLAVVSADQALIIDKVEHNPLAIDGHPAWATLFNFKTGERTPLRMQSNSFCAGGSYLSNGTLVNVGGNPVVEDKVGPAQFGDVDGLQAIRLFHPCDENKDSCKIYENHRRLRMASPRWYATVTRVDDGSAMIMGGSRKGGWINNSTENCPNIEFFPPKSIHGSNGLPIHLPFLVDTLNSNLFPIVCSLPDGTVFVAANRDAMIYDWKRNTERRLPRLPNGVRVTYPMSGSGVLLPLHYANDYAPEVLLCGGSTIDDTRAGYEISSQEPASSQCVRMTLNEEGISKGWQVENMPQRRTMPDMILLPTGEIMILNGAASGLSGYGNVKDQVGTSNADNPVFTPDLYDPNAPAGQRFSSDGMPTSHIPRLYHSVATLTPLGSILIAGSNPNLDRSEETYRTEYTAEELRPSYMGKHRPKLLVNDAKIGFGEEKCFKVDMAKSTKRQDGDVKSKSHFHIFFAYVLILLQWS